MERDTGGKLGRLSAFEGIVVGRVVKEDTSAGVDVGGEDDAVVVEYKFLE